MLTMPEATAEALGLPGLTTTDWVVIGIYFLILISVVIRVTRRQSNTTDYFLAGRSISLWVFVLAATATSFSGWTFMGHPGLVYRDGFQYAYAAFYTITIPFTGVMFLKRQWMLGKRFGYVTPGEMLADYFQGDGIRILTVLVAMLFSIPYLGVQLEASGYLFQVLTDNLVSETFGMWVLSLVVLIYVAFGGLRAVAYVDTMQCILLALGIVITGFIALNAIGGWEAFNQGLAKLAASDVGKWGTTCKDGQILGGGCYNAYFAIPGVIQMVPAGEQAVGGPWTGIMVLTYMFALMGIQASPAFTMWAFGNNDPKPFAPQQVWASAVGIGLLMFFFSVFQGMGAQLLGANPMVNDAGLAITNLLPPDIANNPDSLVPNYFNLIAEQAPWLVGILAVCALAAMQSTGGAYISTAGGMLTRDLYKRYLNPTASHTTQKFFGRVGVVVIVLIALTVATFSRDALVLLGGLAVAFGFQMWPSLVAVCWFPWITRQGATWGLAAGLVGVIFTESIGVNLLALFGLDAWGRWPLTIHSAGWGMLLNATVCIAASSLTQKDPETSHRMKFHTFLREHASLPKEKAKLKPIAWIATLAWLFFGIGPGAVIGNDIFGAPGEGINGGWTFGIPSIWAWQIIFWILGVIMLWFLAYKMEMSTLPDKEVESLTDDFGDAVLEARQR